MTNNLQLKISDIACEEIEISKQLLESFLLLKPNEHKKKKILTECAMLACKNGKIDNMALIIEKDLNILKEKECGIFRMSSEINSWIEFQKIIDYLFKKEYKKHINVNALEGAFLKECIKKNKLEQIQYLIEKKEVKFDLNNEILLKTLVRNKNNLMFEYFVFNLMIPVKENLKDWFIENEYENQWNQIKKRNLFISLDENLKEKNTQPKVKKL